MNIHLASWQTWLLSAALLTAAIVVALIAHYILFVVIRRLSRRAGHFLEESLCKHAKAPARFILLLLAILVVLPALRFPQSVMTVIERVTGLALIAAIAWLVVLFVDIVGDVLGARYRVDVKENLVARKISTQIHVLRRIIGVIVTIVAVALMLMTFPTIRDMGSTMLASAGLAGLVAGLAARSTLSNLLAGVQLALTEPIRIEDAVIVNKEFGWIEEITTTYVVIRIWDLRRMIVPLTYFIEQPFENWTRHTSDLLAKVSIHTDHSVPVEEVRQEFRRILESSGMWDGKVWVLQVNNADERVIELRGLMSVPNAGVSNDLAAYAREKLIAFLQQRYPKSLPRMRTDIEAFPSSGDHQPRRATLQRPGPASQIPRSSARDSS